MAAYTLHGKLSFRLRSQFHIAGSMAAVLLRRACKGPRRPGWSVEFEIGTHFWRRQLRHAFDMADIHASREYFDTVRFHAPVLDRVAIKCGENPAVKGRWFGTKDSRITMLYLHGGGYAYFSRADDHLISLVTEATDAWTFAPDYRLTPEHSFPAQLEDALAAYRWLLARNIAQKKLVIAGDSAGGHLALCLLRAIRGAGLAMPAMAVCISPWTDIANSGASMTANEPFDVVEKRMAERWAEWLTRGQDPRDPDISPLYADFAGFPPIYIQAGGAEILFDMIKAYVEKGVEAGASITLDAWEQMNHDFQAFGEDVVESREALSKIGQVVAGITGSLCPPTNLPS